ncbi:unnamed protein product, partial [Symbiodinium natans]
EPSARERRRQQLCRAGQVAQGQRVAGRGGSRGLELTARCLRCIGSLGQGPGLCCSLGKPPVEARHHLLQLADECLRLRERLGRRGRGRGRACRGGSR